MKDKIEPELKGAIDTGRLLIVSPFENSIKRVSELTAEKRNRFMIELADDVLIGHASKGGMLERIIAQYAKRKTFISLKVCLLYIDTIVCCILN